MRHQRVRVATVKLRWATQREADEPPFDSGSPGKFTFEVKLPHSRLFFFATAAVVVTQSCLVQAAQETVEYTLPITHQIGSDLTVLGHVPLGTPMRLTFTYDPSSPTAHSYADPNEFYYFTSPVTHATFSIGDFTAEMKPAIQLSLSPLGYGLPDRIVPGVLAQFNASTLPAAYPDAPYFAIQTALLWAPGTLDGLAPVMPNITPEILDLSVVVHESQNVVTQFREIVYPNGVPFNPVPEPATYSVLGVCMLGALGALRAWKGRRPSPIQGIGTP